MNSDDFDLSTSIHVDRKNMYLLWKGITEDDLFKCKFYKQVKDRINYYSKIDDTTGLNYVFIETVKRISLNFMVEDFVAGNVLPEEIIDNDILKGWSAYKKPNKSPRKLLHENYIRINKDKSLSSESLSISEIDSINVSNDLEADYELNLLKSKKNSMNKIKDFEIPERNERHSKKRSKDKIEYLNKKRKRKEYYAHDFSIVIGDDDHEISESKGDIIQSNEARSCSTVTNNINSIKNSFIVSDKNELDSEANSLFDKIIHKMKIRRSIVLDDNKEADYSSIPLVPSNLIRKKIINSNNN